MEGKYKCTECDKSFGTKFQLKLHTYQHTGEKPFKCDSCQNAYTTKSKLKSHKKTHDGYPCKFESCSFVAHKWTELQKHIASAHKPKCDVCQKEFNSNYNLKSHKLTHADNREKYLCSYDGCDRAYSKKSNLKMHIKVSHEGIKFFCPIEGCEQELKHKNSLKKHVESHSKPKSDKPKMSSKKKTCIAAKLCGVDVPHDISSEIQQKDIEFRKQLEEIKKNEA